MERPKKYKPESLREYQAPRRDYPLFGIGEQPGIGISEDWVMWQGPNPSLELMLNVVGKTNESRIIEFGLDGLDKVIYKWNQPEQCWKAVE